MSSGNAEQQCSTPRMMKDRSLTETHGKCDDDETGFDGEQRHKCKLPKSYEQCILRVINIATGLIA